MAWRRVPGTAGRYVDTDTGETIPRRRYETQILGRSQQVRARDVRYRAARAQRPIQRAIAATVLGTTLEQADTNKEYFRVRWARNIAGQSTRVRGPIFTVEDVLETSTRANSPFERLWRQAINERFDASPGSAFDRLVGGAGMMTGYTGASAGDYARSHYLEYVRWLMEHDDLDDLGEASDFDAA